MTATTRDSVEPIRTPDTLSGGWHTETSSVGLGTEFRLDFCYNGQVEGDDATVQKLRDYELAQALVEKGVFQDLHFFLLYFEYQRLSPEERLARGLARGRRKYFLIGR